MDVRFDRGWKLSAPRLVLLAATALLAFGSTRAHAQDNNYWSTAYGTRARLLGGVVIGSPGDISSVYYNPGALALTENTEFLLSGSAYQYLRVNVENGSGPGKDLVSGALAAVPSLLAGEVPILKQDRLAYAFLTRQQMDFSLEKRVTTGVGVESPLPNATFAALELQLHQNMSEDWTGFTWAHRLSPTLGIGVSPFVAVRSQRTQVSLLAEGKDAGGNSAVLNQSRDFDFFHWRLLARIGLSGIRDSLTYGLTVTTPGLALFGSGGVRQNLLVIDDSGTVGNVIGASYQKDLTATFHSPLGLGAGGSYGFGSTRLHFSGEWNAEVARYTVMQGVPYTVATPTGDSTVTPIVTEQAKSVVNWGVGIEHRFGPRVFGFASYHTDRSGRSPGDTPGASFTSWNLQHVAAGATFRIARSDFALGGSTAFGHQPLPPLPPRPDGRPLLSGFQVHELLFAVTLGWKISF